MTASRVQTGLWHRTGGEKGRELAPPGNRPPLDPTGISTAGTPAAAYARLMEIPRTGSSVATALDDVPEEGQSLEEVEQADWDCRRKW